MTAGKKTPPKAVRAIVALLVLCVLVGGGFAAYAALSGNDADTAEKVATDEASVVNDAVAPSDEERDSYIAHGTSSGKAETVKVTTDMEGAVTALAVEEWIKNPEEEKTIKDVSSLDNIVVSENEDAVSFTKDGESLKWKTAGNDVKYTGTTDKELPFAITYSYKLDGKEVSPSELENVSGKLEVKISYENKTKGTVKYQGSKYDVVVPYAMVSMIAFDPEHAINVEIDHGTVLDLNGNVLAVGCGMPGLADTLDLGDSVDIPESVTITADVKGFDLPSITTMVTDKLIDALSDNTDDVEDELADVFSSLDNLESGLSKLADANEGLSEGLGKISDGASTMATNLPNATAGLSTFATLAQNISGGVNAAGSNAQSAASDSESAIAAIDSILDESSEGYENLSEDQIAALTQARENMVSAQSSASAASQTLTEGDTSIATAAAGLSSGLTATSEGFEQVVTGAEGLSTALGKVEKASSALAKGTSSVSDGVSSMLSSVKDSVYGKLDTVNAMAQYARQQGAFAGCSSEMDVETTYTITAKA